MLKLQDAGLTLPASAHGERLDRALMTCLPGWSLRACRRLCTEKRVLLQGRLSPPGQKVRAGDRLEILQSPGEGANTSAGRPVLVWLGAHLAVVSKPSGLPTVHLAGSSRFALEDALQELLGPLEHDGSARLLNRLDNETSGLVAVALDAEGQRLWSAAEDCGGVIKYYLAVTEGQLAAGSRLLLDAALDTDNRRTTRVLTQKAPPARQTSVLSLAELPSPAGIPRMLLGCRIFKGARHQIRAHLAAAGFPLAGDTQYGSTYPAPFLLHHARFVIQSGPMKGLAPLLPPTWLDDLPDQAQRCAREWLDGAIFQ